MVRKAHHWGFFGRAVYRVNTRAAMVRFGAAVVRFGAAVVRLGAAVVRVGAGQAHQRAVAENEQRRANGLFWPFFDAFWRFGGGKGVANRAFGVKLAKLSKWVPFGSVWVCLVPFGSFLAFFEYFSITYCWRQARCAGCKVGRVEAVVGNPGFRQTYF